jgi:hypothetical protein
MSSAFVAQFDTLKHLVDTNEYVKNCISNKSKEIHSLSYLIDRDLSQSDCIKLGTGLEKVIKDIIIQFNPLLKDIKPKNSKGNKERDHLFIDEIAKKIYYAELKSNLNLDTEKCKSTSSKCLQIQKELEQKYPDYTVHMYLLGVRYFDTSLIPKIITNKYVEIDTNLLGVNDYFTALNIPSMFGDENEYKQFLNYLADSMFTAN